MYTHIHIYIYIYIMLFQASDLCLRHSVDYTPLLMSQLVFRKLTLRRVLVQIWSRCLPDLGSRDLCSPPNGQR